MTQVERRGAVRVPARLAMEITIATGERSSVSSLNVSASGVYFTSSCYIAALTKLRMTLTLPLEEGESGPEHIVCDGVVVRIEPEASSPEVAEYDVACYFTEVSDRDRLESYILRNVPF